MRVVAEVDLELGVTLRIGDPQMNQYARLTMAMRGIDPALPLEPQLEQSSDALTKMFTVMRKELVSKLRDATGMASAEESSAPAQATTKQGGTIGAVQATPAQINAIYAIGRREYRWVEEEVDAYSRAAFGKVIADLTKREASDLIDRLKAAPEH